VTRTQITLLQIDNYGPWTVTPEPRRETDLQALQAGLYADLSTLVGREDGYVFYARFDNLIAVTNGLDGDDLASIQSSVNNRYPVTVSASTAAGETPVDALAEATEGLQASGSAQDGDRKAVLRGEYLAPGDRSPGDLQVAHFDVVDSTGKYTDRLNAFDSLLAIQDAYTSLMAHMRTRHDSLSFFVGGDNVIAVCPDLPESAFQGAIHHVREDVGVELQVGVGEGVTAHEAGMAAKYALEECRHNGTAVEDARQAIPSD